MANTPGVGRNAVAVASVDNSALYSQVLQVEEIPNKAYRE